MTFEYDSVCMGIRRNKSRGEGAAGSGMLRDATASPRKKFFIKID